MALVFKLYGDCPSTNVFIHTKKCQPFLCNFFNLSSRTEKLRHSIPSNKITFPAARNQDFSWFWKFLSFWWCFWARVVPNAVPKTVPMLYRYSIGTVLGTAFGTTRAQKHHQNDRNFQNHEKSWFRAAGNVILLLGIECRNFSVRLDRLKKLHKNGWHFFVWMNTFVDGQSPYSLNTRAKLGILVIFEILGNFHNFHRPYLRRYLFVCKVLGTYLG